MPNTDLPDIFIGPRNDGLGERLKAIVNAMVLASAYGKDFGFLWPMRKDMHDSHAILPAAEFFSDGFCKKYLLSGEMKGLKGHVLGQQGQLVSDGQTRTAVLTHQYQLPDEALDRAKTAPDGGSFTQHFEKISFQPHVARAANLARAALPDTAFTAIHLRAGDIIEGRYRFEFDRFIRKAYPFTLASEVIARENAQGRKAVIFGQDPVLCRTLAEQHDAIFAGQLASDHGLDQVQTAIFEIVLMSRAKKIIAGNSGFAEMASFLRGEPNENAWTIIPRQETPAITERVLADPAYSVLSPLQRAYARWCAVHDNRGTMPPAWTADQLAQALADDPGNGLYQLFRAVALRQSEGVDAAEAWIGACVQEDERSFRGKRRMGGFSHVLKMQPSPGRLLAEPHLAPLMDSEPTHRRPFTAFALGISLSQKPDRMDTARRLLTAVLMTDHPLPNWVRDVVTEQLKSASHPGG